MHFVKERLKLKSDREQTSGHEQKWYGQLGTIIKIRERVFCVSKEGSNYASAKNARD